MSDFFCLQCLAVVIVPFSFWTIRGSGDIFSAELGKKQDNNHDDYQPLKVANVFLMA